MKLIALNKIRVTKEFKTKKKKKKRKKRWEKNYPIMSIASTALMKALAEATVSAGVYPATTT